MRQIEIFDTTLRDGEQAPGAALTAAAKLEVARALADLGVDVIEAGFPAASDGEAGAVRQIAQDVTGVPWPRSPARMTPTWTCGAKALAPRAPQADPRVHRHIRYHLERKREHSARVLDKCRARRRRAMEQRRRDRVSAEARDTDRHPIPRHVLSGRGRGGRADLNIPDTVGTPSRTSSRARCSRSAAR